MKIVDENRIFKNFEDLCDTIAKNNGLHPFEVLVMSYGEEKAKEIYSSMKHFYASGYVRGSSDLLTSTGAYTGW